MKIAFQMANYFARATNYQTTTDQWGEAERLVIENFSLQEFDRICSDISEAGFRYIEVWMGHAFPKFMTKYKAEELQHIWKKYQLSPISYSCSLGDPIEAPHWTRMCFETASMLGINMITSGISKESAPLVYEMCKEFDMKVAVENHPEKHPDIIREIIGEYSDMLGAAVDTGWFGTQGFPADEAIRQLQDVLIHVHLKDVQEPGSHHTIALGEGIVPIQTCVDVLKEIEYDGPLAIEHEAGDHDPTEDCRKALEWLNE
ncbi:TIM barrel protein [Gracilibacillus salitolerans]|uniref:TIM barrel protein n=1 Tax=Gracilibacillus salitolerans TaxID=2663022 RepID=A0A5Q2TFQ7_9BACI|nr:sugar phosphate isomerase/epimerase [Gracilibacillus salitolerans]QGH33634.1 TIM barrel protein [Gracilibacillus salitolerans]